MKKLVLLSVLSMVTACLCSGCCSTTVWQETGKSITHVESLKIDSTKQNELTAHSAGWTENIIWLPWYATGHEPWEQHVTLPLDYLPNRSIGHQITESWIVDTWKEHPRFSETNWGIWTMEKYQGPLVFFEDIPHLSAPFIRYSSATHCRELIVPLEVRDVKDFDGPRTIYVRGYLAHTVIFPKERDIVEKLDGTGITIWKCCLLPIPIVIDIATSPFQLCYLLLKD